MAKLPPNLDFTNVVMASEKDKTPKLDSLMAFVRMIQKKWQDLAIIFNGHIGFGDGTSPDNIDGVWATLNSGAGNVDVTITHNLGRVPVGYLPMTKSAACDVYTGSVGATASQITLRGSVAGATVKLFII